FEDTEQRLWIGTYGGLNRYDRKTDQFNHYQHSPDDPTSLSNNKVTTIIQHSKDKLWVGTHGGGLNLFDVTQQQFVRYQHIDGNSQTLASVYVRSLYQNDKQQLWIGTYDRGLNILHLADDHFNHYRHQGLDPNSLSENSIRSIYPDRQGLVWIGTNGGGVNKYDSNRERFGHIRHHSDNNRSLSNNQVWAIYEDSKQRMWVGTKGGLNRFNPDGTVTVYTFSPTDPTSLSHNSVSDIVEDNQGRMWVATWGAGVNLFDSKTEQFTRFTHDRKNPDSLGENRVKFIFQDSRKMLWFGTFGGGLNRLDESTQKFEQFRHDASDPNTISNDKVISIAEDSTGSLWIGTEEGLNHLDVATGKFQRFRHDQENPTSLSHNYVTVIKTGKKGVLWLGTYGGGLNRFNTKSGEFSHFRKKQGMINDSVRGIVKDNLGDFWISTTLGLSRFDSVKTSFTHYNVNDGLQSSEFNEGAYFRSNRGELFFGGINGLNRFFAADITPVGQQPAVVFTEFLLFNQPVAVGLSHNNSDNDKSLNLPKAINVLEQISLTYKHSLVAFEFAALDHRNPERNTYAYMLEGLDQEWIYTDAKNRRATYTNLPAGDYRLKIKAANANGVWHEPGTSIDISVSPPYWKTTEAFVFYGVLVMLLVYILDSIRSANNAARAQLAVNHKLTKLDKLKDAFLANTSHELRTPLNGIIGLAESLIDGVAGKLPEKANKNLAMVVTSGRRLSHLINDILDLSKLKHASIKLNLQSLDLRALTDVVFTLSQPLIGIKKLTLINKVPEDFPLVWADEDRLLQILHNLIGNGIKFTDSGSVVVSVERQQQGISISIADTGIGIDENKYTAIFDSFGQVQRQSDRIYGGTGLGLTISKQLVELHGGTINVKSVIGEGTTFSFTLTLSDGRANQQSKTRPIRPTPLSMNVETSDEQRVLNMPTVGQGDEHEDEQHEHQSTGRFRLLLVDDEPINLQVLHNHLSLKYQLVEAADGVQALAAIEEQGPFDLVLLDIMMPRMSGYEVCKKIRESLSVNELPVIFLTAKNQMDDLVQGFAVGANDHINKPVAKLELLSRVDTHLKLLDINRDLESKVEARTNELMAAQQKMVLSEKLATLGTLMAGVAHEIKNPTNFVNICVDSLEKDLNECEEFIYQLAGEDAEPEVLAGFSMRFTPLHEHIKTIKDGTNRIKSLVRDLKMSSYMDIGEKETVYIDEILMSTINLVAAKFKNEVDIISDFKAHPQLSCYPAKLNQVFMNLIINACDALAEKQQPGKTRPKIEIGCQICDQQVEISIKDNGCGMSEDTKAKLFEPFYTTKGVAGGTGLGLSISFDIVHKHGGELTVESELGVGTTFHLMLPRRGC
ncbi:MAG: response regulator, partial [Algicola sp.]|nr:response regulator [Algicola sp.]